MEERRKWIELIKYLMVTTAICYVLGMVLWVGDARMQARSGNGSDLFGKWSELWLQFIAPWACALALPIQAIVFFKVKRYQYAKSAAISLIVLVAIRDFVGRLT